MLEIMFGTMLVAGGAAWLALKRRPDSADGATGDLLPAQLSPAQSFVSAEGVRAVEPAEADALADHAAALAESMDPSTLEHDPAEHSLRNDPPRVLVADDNVVNLMVAARILERLGCEVSRAADGREALEVARARPLDLILMDCQMPEMDGFEATVAILSEEEHAHLPIVAVTAFTSDNARAKAVAAGMMGFISKPISLERIRSLVLEHCPWWPAEVQPNDAPRAARRASQPPTA